MKFVYGPKDLFENVGFQTEHWRHSESGTHVLCHLDFAETLIPDTNKQTDIQVFDHKDEMFQLLIQKEFTPKPVPVEEEAEED